MDIVLIIAIPVLLILAAVMIIATGRKRAASDPEGRVTGTLSAETRQRDQSARRRRRPPTTSPPSARERADETRKAIGSGGAAPATRGTTAVMERPPVDEEELGISRRQFFNRGILVTMALSLGAFGAAAISFLYAKSAGGFGGTVDAGISLTDAIAYNNDKKEPYYVPEARSYLRAVPEGRRSRRPRRSRSTRRCSPGWKRGSSPSTRSACTSAARFRGARRRSGSSAPATARSTTGSARSSGGPAPRGLDRFVVTVSGEKLSIDTGVVDHRPADRHDTTGQGAEGPPCVG